MTDIYTPAINTFIEQIKGDKSLDPKWRNKAIARQEESLAFIRMAQTTTRQTPPDGTALTLGPTLAPTPPLTGSKHYADTSCICQPGGKHRDCPVHGWA